MKKSLLGPLLLGSILLTSGVQAGSHNFRDYEIDISLDEQAMSSSKVASYMTQSLLLMGVSGITASLYANISKEISTLEKTDVVKLMSKKAELVSLKNSFEDETSKLERTKKLTMAQAHIDRTISLLKHAKDDNLTHVYAPASVHKKIIVNRIADTILEGGLKLDKDIRKAVVRNIESSIYLGKDLTDNMRNSEVARKVSMLESEYRLITADTRIHDLKMAERSMKTSVISKELRKELIEDLKNVSKNLEAAKLGKTSLKNKIESLDRRIDKATKELDNVRSTVQFKKAVNGHKNVIGAVGVVSLLTSGYLVYEVADRIIEIEVLENGSTRILSISDVL